MVHPVLLQPFRRLPLPSSTAFARQTAIVTGSNTGLGLETARHLLAHGASPVILAVRNAAKGEAAKASLLKTPGVPAAARVDVWDLDQASFASVRAFAARAAALPQLDLLFLNAGVMDYGYHTTVDGWENTLQVNILSPTLLALLLLPKLVQSSNQHTGTSHLIAVSSALHEYLRFPSRSSPRILERLSSSENFPPGKESQEQYSTTKLLNIFIIRELAKLVSATDVVVNCVDPGWCDTEILRVPKKPIVFRAAMALLGRTAECGSRNLIAAAVAGEESHGGYIASAEIASPGGLAVGAEGAEVQRMVWGEIVEVLRKVAPEIGGVVDGGG